MEVRHDLTVACTPERLFSWVDDLSNYPPWMTLVHDVRLVDSVSESPAWDVELQAKVGPFTRSKRLRMVRTVHEPMSHAVFERREVDGRQHASWVLTATVTPVEQDPLRSSILMELRYGGSLWTGAVLQRVLDDEIRKGSTALVDVVSREPTH